MRLAATAMLLVAAAALGACGGGGKDADGRATAGTTTTKRQLPGTGRPLVTIGDKNFTEQFVLGELYAQALSARGYSVELNRNIGPLEVTMQALRSGRLDMYPEYVGTWNDEIAGDRRRFRTARAAFLAARHYADQHGLAMLDPTPFSDTGAIAVTVTYGWAHRLRSLGDLRKVAQALTLGAPPQFQQSSPGLPVLEQTYGFVPAAFKALAVGAQYQALDQGLVQAAEVETTDGQLESGNYRLLSDPARVFGYGEVAPIVPPKVLLAEGPAFAATIDRVTGLLTLPAIRELNAQVDVYGRDPATVAKAFLQANGLIPAAGS